MELFGLVVEGNDDETALSELVQKCKSGVEVITRKCGNRVKLLRQFPSYLEDFRHAKEGKNVDKALVIRDADQKNPAHLINDMRVKINNRHYAFPVKLLVIVQELEAWLLADETAVSLATGQTTQPTQKPEGLSDPKQKLKNVLSDAKTSYTPEVARKIAANANLDVIGARCPSFRVFREAVIDC